jgi:hypothetical protein
MDLKETGRESVNWIYLARDTSQWRPSVNNTVNLMISKEARNYLFS